jgi:16S rRNA (cytidine1402-2'-O)-methyltransferase
LKDLSLRQYEALQNCDILACEDTRTTGKLLTLLKNKRVLGAFQHVDPKAQDESEPLNATGDEAQPKSGTMTTSAILPGTALKSKSKSTSTSTIVTATGTETATNAATETSSAEEGGVTERKEELSPRLKEEVRRTIRVQAENKSISTAILDAKKEDVKELLEGDYFRRVENDEDFDERKAILEAAKPIMAKRLEVVAKKYDDERKLAHIMKRKPRHEEKEEAPQDDYEFLYGIDNEQVQDIKARIEATKKRKGRGVMVSLHSQNEDKRIPRLIKTMKLGFSVGLVSEAGTPTISDPGAMLIAAAQQQGIAIEPLPGPCAAIVALTASGLQQSSFVFHGFLPKARGPKNTLLVHYCRLGLPLILYESRERLENTLELVETVFGADRKGYIGIELTKLHESHHYGTVAKLKELARGEGIPYKGELTVVIAGAPRGERGLEADEEEDSVRVNVEELAHVLNKTVQMKDSDFKSLLTKITGLSQATINDVIKKIRPKPKRFNKLTAIMHDPKDI